MRYEIIYSCVSHIGNIRSMNQDNFICNGKYSDINNQEIEFPLQGNVTSNNNTLFGVLDGMGGEECGEIAAFIAAKEASLVKTKGNPILNLKNYCKSANNKICEYAEKNSIFSMGTTAAMLLFSKKDITLCNIGDSKVFHISDGSIKQISEDHVAISVFGTKPPLSQNLGIPPSIMEIDPYFSQGTYKKGDRYLICSDGLTDMLTNEEINNILEENTIHNATSILLDEALMNGGKDNTTIILLEIQPIKSKLLKIFNKDIGGKQK